MDPKSANQSVYVKPGDTEGNSRSPLQYILFSLGILVLIASLGLFVFSLNKWLKNRNNPPNKTETISALEAETPAKPKTFDFKEYGFSLDLPSDWKKEKDPANPEVGFLIGPTQDVNKTGEKVDPFIARKMWLKIIPKTNGNTFASVQKTITDCAGVSNTEQVQKTTVDGKEATIIRGIPCGSGPNEVLLWENQDNVFGLYTDNNIDTYIPTVKWE